MDKLTSGSDPARYVECHGNSLRSGSAIRQLFSYTIVGVLSNLIGYAMYLGVTYFGGTPKSTMTVLYFVGTLISFFANRRFTFCHNGHIAKAGVRFILAYALGYFVQWFLLVLFVDKLGFPHPYVQGGAIVVVAGFLFVLSRYFVFAPNHADNRVN